MGSSNIVELAPGESFTIQELLPNAAKIVVDPGATTASTRARSSVDTYELDIQTHGAGSVDGVPLTSSVQARREYITGDIGGLADVTVTNTGSTTGSVLLEAGSANDLEDVAGKSETVLLSQELQNMELAGALDAQGNDIRGVGAFETEELNNVQYIDPSVLDIATAVQEAEDAFPTPSVTESHTFRYGRWDNMDSTTGWNGVRGDESLSSDSTEVQQGSASLEFTHGGTDNPGIQKTALGGQDWTPYDLLRVWMKSNLAKRIALTLTDTDGNTSNTLEKRIDTTGAWVELEFDLNELKVGSQGNFNQGSVDAVQFVVQTGDGSLDINVDDIRRLGQAHLNHDAIKSLSIGSLSEGSDYTVDDIHGIVTPIVGGGLPSGSSLDIDYSYYEQGEIILRQGDYPMDSTIRIERPKTTLKGQGWSSRIYRNSNNAVLQVEADHCHVEDLQIDGRYQDDADEIHNIQVVASGASIGTADSKDIEGVVIRNVWSHHAMGDGVEIAGKYHEITHCLFEDNFEDDVHVRVSEGIRVVDNTCRGNGGDAIKLWDNTGSETIENALIADNLVVDYRKDGIQLGVKDDAVDCTVRDNDLRRGQGDAISMDSSNGSGNKILNNDIIKTDKGIVVAEGGSLNDIVIEGNTARDLDGLFIQVNTVPDAVILDNYCQNVDDDGIRVEGHSRDTHIVGNIIKNANQDRANDRAAIIVNDDGSGLTRCFVERNKVINTVGFTRDGIRFTGTTTTTTTCIDNHVENGGFDRVQSPPDIFRGLTGEETSENGGTATFDGDGSTTVFSISHGLIQAPAKVNVEPDLGTAATPIDGIQNITSASFDVVFSSAPPSGTNNVDVIWEAEV